MNGYPSGTKCVITWDYTNIPNPFPPGMVVECRGGIADHSRMNASVYGLPHPGCVWQEVSERYPATGAARYHPVGWMRPIDADTDESDREVIEELKPKESARRGREMAK